LRIFLKISTEKSCAFIAMAAAKSPRPALMIITRVEGELDDLVKILERTYLSEVQISSEGFKISEARFIYRKETQPAKLNRELKLENSQVSLDNHGMLRRTALDGSSWTRKTSNNTN
jgi:hypothetical protein